MFQTLAALAVTACASTRAAPSSAVTSPRPAPPATAQQSAALGEFERAARAMGLVYQPLAGFTETAVTDNTDVDYDYAIASADGGVEMRFALRPHSMWPPEMAEAARNQLRWPFFMTAIANITRGGRIGEVAPPQSVPVQPFGADEAKMVVVRIAEQNADKTSFALGFRFCFVVYLHKAAAGDAYIFVLAKDMEAFDANMTEEKFHTLRFAEG